MRALHRRSAFQKKGRQLLTNHILPSREHPSAGYSWQTFSVTAYSMGSSNPRKGEKKYTTHLPNQAIRRSPSTRWGLKAFAFHLRQAESKMAEHISLSFQVNLLGTASCSFRPINAYLESQEESGWKEMNPYVNFERKQRNNLLKQQTTDRIYNSAELRKPLEG